MYFNPHTRKGVRIVVLLLMPLALNTSIHAPTWGATTKYSKSFLSLPYLEKLFITIALFIRNCHFCFYKAANFGCFAHIFMGIDASRYSIINGG